MCILLKEAMSASVKKLTVKPVRTNMHMRACVCDSFCSLTYHRSMSSFKAASLQSVMCFLFHFTISVNCSVSCRNTPSPPPSGGPKGGVIYLCIVLSLEGASYICLCFWQRQPRKSNNVVVFPFAFHITVQQSLQLLLSCLLLCDHEPS